jgi:hypothetical protein
VLAFMLTAVGCEVILPSIGRQAVEASARYPGPDIVFLDMRCPRSTRIEATRRILMSSRSGISDRLSRPPPPPSPRTGGNTQGGVRMNIHRETISRRANLRSLEYLGSVLSSTARGGRAITTSSATDRIWAR